MPCPVSSGSVASRHGIINDIVCRAFTSAGIPAIKEPTGLIKEGALRPDGMTLTPWSEGRSLTWDVTVVHTLAQNNLAHSVHAAGSAAEAAAARKVNKYVSLTSTHLFVPIALETLGPVCGSALDLLSTLGSRSIELDHMNNFKILVFSKRISGLQTVFSKCSPEREFVA